MLCNGFWCYIGSPVPASTNDIGLLNTEWPNIKRIMDPKERDLMIADRIFIDFEKKFQYFVVGEEKVVTLMIGH